MAETNLSKIVPTKDGDDAGNGDDGENDLSSVIDAYGPGLDDTKKVEKIERMARRRSRGEFLNSKEMENARKHSQQNTTPSNHDLETRKCSDHSYEVGSMLADSSNIAENRNPGSQRQTV